MGTGFQITKVASRKEADQLDELLWEVLWKPLGLPRDVRKSFKLEGEEIEIVAQVKARLVGGIVGVGTSPDEFELRHLAVESSCRGANIGSRLVRVFVDHVRDKGATRIKTIARNTSVDFFRKMGFESSSVEAPEHPVFKQHGITFKVMEKAV